MTLTEAIEELRTIAQQAKHSRHERTVVMPKVKTILHLFRAANSAGNLYVTEKISQVEIYFKVLTKRDLAYASYEPARQNFASAIGKLAAVIADDNSSLDARWR